MLINKRVGSRLPIFGVVPQIKGNCGNVTLGSLAMLFYNQRQHVHLHGFGKQAWDAFFSLDICAWGNISLCPCASQVDTTKDTQEYGNFDMFL